jgi:hypothetical protein
MIIEGERIITFVVHDNGENYSVQMSDTENSLENGYKTVEFAISPDNIGRIASLFTNGKYAFVGFGNKYKDNVILNYVIKNRDFLKTVNTRFITESIAKTMKEIEDDEDLKKQYKYASMFNSFDLQRFLFSKDEAMSLEAFVKSSDYTFTDTEHDSLNIANILYDSKDKIDARLKIEEIYGEDLFDGCEGVVGAKLMKSLYAKKNNVKQSDLKPMATKYSSIRFSDVIFPSISFRSQQLSMMLDDLKKTVIDVKDNWFYYVSYKNLSMTMNLAGLRMNTEPQKLFSDEDGELFNIDVASFYPSIAVKCGIKPGHVNNTFSEVMQDMLSKRLEFKASDKHVSDAMKRMLNGIIGQFMIEGSWLYDPMASFRIRINGALMMLMLIEELYDYAEIECVTIDGMFVKAKHDISSVVSQWSGKTGLDAVVKSYDYVYMLSNNDYMASDGTRKGFFSDNGNNGTTRKPDVVRDAVIKNLIDGTPISETVTNCHRLDEFVASVSSSTAMEWCGSVFNNARFYWSTDQRINKISDSSAFNVTMTPMTQDGVTVTDTLTEGFPDNIDYRHYISEAGAIVEKLNVQQLKLF